MRYWTKIHADSYDPQEQTVQWLVRLVAVDFDIKHKMGRQHSTSNADGMSRHPMLKCAQCETRHQGAYETKKMKKVDLVTVCSSTQTEKGRKTRVKASKKEEGSELAQDAVQTDKAKVLTRSQGPKSLEKVTNPSWVDDAL